MEASNVEVPVGNAIFLTLLGKFDLTRTALKLVPGTRPTFSEWEAVGEILRVMEGSVQFWIADWVNLGDQLFSEKASQAMDATGWKYETVQQYSRVGKQIPPERRRADLSFSHHREVGDLQPPDQERWLDRAAEGTDGKAMSVSRLRMEINREKRLVAGEPETPCALVVLLPTLSEREMLRGLAESRGYECITPETYGPEGLLRRLRGQPELQPDESEFVDPMLV